jgi:hypothetical protein
MIRMNVCLMVKFTKLDLLTVFILESYEYLFLTELNMTHFVFFESYKEN